MLALMERVLRGQRSALDTVWNCAFIDCVERGAYAVAREVLPHCTERCYVFALNRAMANDDLELFKIFEPRDFVHINRGLFNILRPERIIQYLANGE